MWDGSVLCWKRRCTAVSLVDVVSLGSRRVYDLKCSIKLLCSASLSWFAVCERSKDESWLSQFFYLNLSGINVLVHLKHQNCRRLVCHGSDAVTRKVESHTYVTYTLKSATLGVHPWFKLAVPQFYRNMVLSRHNTMTICYWWFVNCQFHQKWRARAKNGRTYLSGLLQL